MVIAHDEALRQALDQVGVRYELLPHRHTESAKAEARALGLEPDEVAKTVVVRTREGYVRAVVPASRRVDLIKLRELLRTADGIRLATEPELVAAYPDFDLGAVPPVGGPDGDLVVVDTRLARRVHAIFEAGTHEESVRVKTDDLVDLTGAWVGDVSAP